MRLTIVQYAGDYREAVERFEAGGQSTYQAQRYSVQFVASLAEQYEQVAVVTLRTAEPFDDVLANGVRAVGVGCAQGLDAGRFIAAVAATRPTHLVITTPFRPLLAWARAHKLPSICVLADSFDERGWRQWVRHWRLRRMLASTGIAWVGNHGLNACLSLVDIGVDPAKIVPWDWPPAFRPHDQEPRTRASGPLRLAYVGSVAAAKGVGDLIDALALLRDRGITTSAVITGPDHEGAMAAYAVRRGLADTLTFTGPIPNEDVPRAMREADAVVVPSRHEYPEGLPLTIYEALAARTPLLASDHPMFRGVLVDGTSAAIFRASDPASMADAIEALGNDVGLYSKLSFNAQATWEALQLPVRWGDLIIRWLEGDARWLADHSLASGRYDEALASRRAARKANLA